jgi:DNA-binding LacI/PurR family transcriptional regulator
MKRQKETKPEKSDTGNLKLADVALRAGVSVSTVSRVVNGSPLVNPQKQAAVKKVMQEMGYEPLPIERRRGARKPLDAAPSKQSVRVVLVGELGLNWITDYAPVYAYALNGIEQALAELKINRTIERVSSVEEFSALVNGGGSDGFLVLDTTGRASFAPMSGQSPVVAFMGIHDGTPFDRVTPDHYLAGELAANHLRQTGCKSFAVLGGRSPIYDRRVLAFTTTITRSGGEVTDLWAPDLLNRGPSLHQVMAEAVGPLVDSLAGRKKRPLGLFLTMDILAPCVYAELVRVGLTLGKDIHMVRCNNERPYLNSLHPQPAVVDVRAAEIGRRAMFQLLQRMRFPKEACVSLLVAPELVEP